MENKKDIIYSYYTIRKIIGILGILLPLMVIAFHGEIIASISHYYYTKSAVFFIAILSAFGLFLISYKGYERDKDTEWLSDNVITHIGGFAALMLVLFPTSCGGSGSDQINLMWSSAYPLFGHDINIISTIHLISAGIFLLAMGWMSIHRFTKGELTKEKRRKNKIYKFSGYIMWASVAFLLLEFVINFKVSMYDTFILETVSIVAFGISWLIKGETIKDLIDLKNGLFKRSVKS